MAEKGATAKSMRPSYPSKTFPNHYTLVTGLYPGNHGLVDNSFYDPDLDLRYKTSDRTIVENTDFYGGWPIWQWAKENGLRSASYFWVGSEAPIHGHYPDFWKKYDHDFPNQARIDSVFRWFELPPAERPNIVTLYFALIDDAGHAYGTDDKRLERSLKKADDLLQTIRKKIKSSGLPIDLVVVSDHGMYTMAPGPSTYIDLMAYTELPKDALRISNSGTHMHIYINDQEFGKEFYEKLKANQGDFSIYRLEDIPENWHYNKSGRIGDFLLVAEPGFSFIRSSRSEPYGAHGYDPYKVPEMGAIFYAEGPGVMPGVTLPEFQNVDVFSFVCELLGIPAATNDGDLDVLGKALRKRN
jgi:predicted AlkP superfamily pyrophosphatase or phosphodiesterase